MDENIPFTAVCTYDNESASYQRYFDRITMDSGLSSSSVTSILKDRTGYVWVGTTEGLNRYDGYTFKVFLPVPDCPESIQSSSIDKLFEDSDGGIWIFFPRVGLAVMTEVRIHF